MRSETLKVRVDEVKYPPVSPDDESKDDIWYIFLTDKGCCKGKVGWRPKTGEFLKLEGQWGQRHGQKEFQFKAATQDIPISSRDQLRYVAERTPGIGTSIEMQIWETWGETWMTDVESGVITRLSGKTYEDMRGAIDSFELEKEKAEAISWLMGKGATLAMSTAAWKEWDKQAITVVNIDCYRLADLPNHGFANIDKTIRFEFGIVDNDPRRISAAVVYCLKQLTEMGSTVVTWRELDHKCTEVLKGVYTMLVCQCVKEQFDSGVLRAFTETQSISLGRDYENENDILKYVTKDNENPKLELLK